MVTAAGVDGAGTERQWADCSPCCWALAPVRAAAAPTPGTDDAKEEENE